MAVQNGVRNYRWWIVSGIVAVLAIIGGAAYFGYTTSQAQQVAPPAAPPTVSVSKGDVVLSVTATGTSVNTHKSTIGAKVNTTIDEILVQAGDVVKAGQVLARLGDVQHFETLVTNAQIQVLQAQKALSAIDDQLALSQAALALAQAQKAYDTAKQNAASKQFQRGEQDAIDVARANLVLATQALRDAEDIFNRNKNRSDSDPEFAAALSQLAAARTRQATAQANLNWLQGLPDPNDVAQVQAHLGIARANLDDAQQKYNLIAAGNNPDRVLAEEQLKSAQAALDEAKADRSNLEVTAPYDGIVTSIQASVGQTVAAGAPLMTLIDPKAIDVEATVVEEDLPLIDVGQAVQLYFDALPDAEVTGRVERIIPERVSGSSQANYTIVVSLDQVIDHLVAGMSVDGSIVVSQKSNILRLPRSVVHAQPDGAAIVQVWNGVSTQQRTIHVGLRGDSYSEVLDGLNDGDQVVAQ